MGGNKSKGLSPEEIEYLKRRVSFSTEEIVDWHKEYKTISKHGRYLSVEQFKKVYSNIFDGDARGFAEHVFRTFDHNGDGKVDFTEFLIGLSISASANRNKKLKWAFSMYDIDGNGKISREEMVDLMRAIYRMTPSIIKPPDVATPEMITDKLFRKIDKNSDNEITWEEFHDGALNDPLVIDMLELNPEPSSP